MHEKIHLLMSGYFIGNLTESELRELKDDLELIPADRKIFEDYRLLWEQSGQSTVPNPIDVESDLLKVKRKIQFKKINLFHFLQRAAAVLLLAGLFSATYIYFYHNDSITYLSERKVMEQEITTVFGARSKFQLPDGTTVTLNSGSKLVFPVEFKGNNRKVSLTGEAFFEVTPDTSKPFIVKTSLLNVKVMGTAFDLQAYPGTDEIATTLVHGRVILESESIGVVTKLADLKPFERAVYKISGKTIKLSSEEDLDKFVGWKEGKLVFFNDPIDKVAEKIGNWYNVTVTISNSELLRFHFTATFTDEPIEHVLDLLSKSSPIRYRIKKAARLSNNTYSKREIVLY